ncbi:MAG: hypothetical protein JXB32_16445 [Deltaproteobacteria bacterium]|nr:hypothetical protein [Deltaproteobacteria bacterium]
MRIAIAVLVSSSLWAAAAAAECRDSAGGSCSLDIRLSPAAGCLCLMSVAVFEGPGCDAEHRLWGETLGCNVTDRMAVTDRGFLVSILAPATAHPEWSIVSVLWWRDGGVVQSRLALEDLSETAGLAGVVRPRFEGTAIRFSPEVLVPFERLEAAAGGP